MAEMFIILSLVGYLFYRVVFFIPKQIQETQEKIDVLKFNK